MYRFFIKWMFLIFLIRQFSFSNYCDICCCKPFHKSILWKYSLLYLLAFLFYFFIMIIVCLHIYRFMCFDKSWFFRCIMEKENSLQDFGLKLLYLYSLSISLFFLRFYISFFFFGKTTFINLLYLKFSWSLHMVWKLIGISIHLILSPFILPS